MKTIDELGISKTPWYACDFGVPKSIQDCHDEIIVTVYATKTMDANARIIAAAPDCYEALAAVVSWYERNKPLSYEENGIQMIMDYAKKAIAKASGEEVK